MTNSLLTVVKAKMLRGPLWDQYVTVISRDSVSILGTMNCPSNLCLVETE